MRDPHAEPAGSVVGSSDHGLRGRLTSSISNAVVRIYADYVGRGPTKAKTSISGTLVTVVLQDALTKAEHRLIERGEEDAVLSNRRVFQSTMREDLVEMVEDLCHAKVIAFLSDHQARPDYAVEAFVLDGPPAPLLPEALIESVPVGPGE
jgi:uncharacterized protein YbcI